MFLHADVVVQQTCRCLDGAKLVGDLAVLVVERVDPHTICEGRQEHSVVYQLAQCPFIPQALKENGAGALQIREIILVSEESIRGLVSGIVADNKCYSSLQKCWTLANNSCQYVSCNFFL